MRDKIVIVVLLLAIAAVMLIAWGLRVPRSAGIDSPSPAPVVASEVTVPSTTSAQPIPIATPASTPAPRTSGPTRPAPPKPSAPSTPAVDPWDVVYARMAAQLPARWTIADRGSWGAVSLNTGTVYIARRTPVQHLADVMRHEWIHVQQWRVYGSAARAALAPFGGIEVMADCGAIQLGARWTNYTRSCTAEQNRAAAAIRRGVKP